MYSAISDGVFFPHARRLSVLCNTGFGTFFFFGHWDIHDLVG